MFRHDPRAALRGAPSLLASAIAASLVTSLVAGGVGHASSARPTAGAVTAERLKLPSGPSSVRGLADEPSIDPFYAQLEYQVPFELPGGLGGLAPRLGLVYSGALGNGPVGIGWTLGQPRIQRSTRRGVPAYQDSDELEISGIVSGRLVALPSGEYRVEGMGQTVRVQKVDGGFQIDDGSGVRYRLGTSDASRQRSDADTTRVLAWLVEQETNLQGETINYTYTRDQNQVYLSGVTWGPGGRYTATLGYEARTDAARSYRGGFSVVTAQRLKTVTVSVVTAAGTTVRRTYHLAYDPSFSVARLSGVTSDGEGGDGSWPPLSFTYAAPAPAVTEVMAGVGTWRLNSNGVSLADVDGDGAADLVQLATGGDAWMRNRNGTYGELQSLTGNSQALSSVQLQDVDGDARPELVSDTGNGWAVWKFTSTAWTPLSTQWPGSVGLALKSPTTTRFADLNGDGLIDAMTWNNDHLFVHFATSTGLGAAVTLPKIAGTQTPAATTGRFQDTNGDGLDDYLNVFPDHIDLYIGHGDGTFDAATRINYPFAGTISNVNDIELADLDRDGLIDLINIASGNVTWYRGVAAGGFASSGTLVRNPETLTSNVVVAIADTNGNGSQDIVWSSLTNMWRLDVAGTTTAGMLKEVQNGLGLDTTFAYQSAHALEIAAEDAGNGWATTVPIAMPVPIQRRTALGAGETTREINYSVRDGFWDVTEARFAGFSGTTVTTAGATPDQTSTVTTVYLNGIGADRELRGKPFIVQVFNGGSQRLSATSNTWQTMPVSGLPDTPLLRRAILKETTVTYDDVDVTPKRSTDVVYTYDAFGRATHVVDSGRNDVTGDEVVTDTTYADDDTTWVRDRVCEEKVSGTDGTVVSDVQTLFGDDQVENALCVVGKGWPRETRALLDSESRYVTQSATSYNTHGNPTTITTSGVSRTLSWDPDDLFPTDETVTAPSGGNLVWHADWDPVLGVLTHLTDPNDHTSVMSYDSLGRYTGTSIDGRPQHVVVEYDWTAPFPKTTTWQFDGALADVTAKPAQWSATSGWRQSVEVSNGKGQVRYHAVRLADAQWIVSDYHEVDPNDRVVFAGRPVITSSIELAARPDGIVGDALAYDPLGRLIEQDLPTGTKRTYSYIAFERTMQDADLAPVHSVLDGQGHAILTERSLPDGTHEIVTATYDPAGRMTAMSLADGAVTRSFSYDTLGRLKQSSDPDLGTRTLTWDDGNRLRTETNAANQTIQYTYDSLGRLSTRDTGSLYTYHYDAARPGAPGPASNLAGQLAWVEEPTGGIDLSYDEFGRATFTRRRIDAQSSEQTKTLSASGLALGESYDDGFALTYQYDPAGRLIHAGNLWSLLDQDAMGQPLHEQTANGVDTRTTRDILGLPSEINVQDGTGTAIYHVSARRNAWTAITSVTDLDGTGLDHTAAYSYDGFARLTSATLGTDAHGFTFGYAYDVLHNMTSRTASPPVLGAFIGTYRYAESGAAPRQLTSISDTTGQVTHSFGYDAAGRQTMQDQQTMTYDASDRVLRVDGVSGGAVMHAYGQDGARIKTTAPDSSVSYFFGDGTALRGGVREHDVEVGSRIVARISTPATTATGAAVFGATLGAIVSLGARALGLALLGVALVFCRRWTRRRVLAAATVGLALAASCSTPGVGRFRNQLSTAATTTFLHTGFAAGPALFTDDHGHLLEERRYEPFGVPVDAKVHTANGDVVGPPDVVARDLNELNKRTDATTGWSDHGARWLAPETGRWLTPDPPVAGPDDEFMFAPWALHPYQYVHQNPVIYWDPDGRFIFLVALVVAAVLIETEGTANAPTPTTPPERIIPAPTNAEIAWGTAKVGVSAIGGVGATGVMKGTLEKLVLAGGTAAVVAQGVDDLHHGQFSGVGTYAGKADDAALLAGVGAGAGAVLSSPAARTGFELTEGELARDLHAEAIAARDSLAGELAAQRHPPATVVGAYSPSLGTVTAGASRGGGLGCAEGVCSEALGNPRDIQFTPAIRPRTGQPVDVCSICEATYGRGAFPDPTTRFSTDREGQ